MVGRLAIESQDGNHAFVKRLWTLPSRRGRGIATELIQRICADADTEGVTLVCRPERIPGSMGGLTDEELRQWYANFGGTFDSATGYQSREPHVDA